MVLSRFNGRETMGRLDRLQRAVLLARLIEELRAENSWCGETHVQKATYIAQSVVGIEMGFEFILYKHGPFSFDLRDELTALRADRLVELELKWPYGPRIAATDRISRIQKYHPKTLRKYEGKIRFVADVLGSKDVVDLERLGTAFFVSRLSGVKNARDDEIAGRICRLKRHISSEEAIAALQQARKIEAEARKEFPS